MIRIIKITLSGDLVEVEAQIDGVQKIVRRHVQGYSSLNQKERQDLWGDIIGVKNSVDYQYRSNLWTRFKLMLTKERKI